MCSLPTRRFGWLISGSPHSARSRSPGPSLEAQPAPLTVVVSLICFLEVILLPCYTLPTIHITGIHIRSRISLNQIEKSDGRREENGWSAIASRRRSKCTRLGQDLPHLDLEEVVGGVCPDEGAGISPPACAGDGDHVLTEIGRASCRERV